MIPARVGADQQANDFGRRFSVAQKLEPLNAIEGIEQRLGGDFNRDVDRMLMTISLSQIRSISSDGPDGRVGYVRTSFPASF